MAKAVEGDLQIKSLATKYRPLTLDYVIGQDDVVDKIKGAIKTKRLPSTFLLTGGTGRGKTTVSRLIARYINCDTFNACGKCENCKAEENHPDFEDLNMASSRGIDDVKEVIRRARNAPRLGRFRIILLDEAHQMTPQAAQCLLKPLEEPPPKTLWIIATTDPEKLPKTVLGRCMVLNMKAVPQKAVAERLAYIAKKEGFKFKEKVYLKIAEATGGHVRNAIQLLDNLHTANTGAKGGLKTSALVKMIERDAGESSEAGVEEMAVRLLVACYGLNVRSIWRFMLDFQSDGVSIVNKMMWLNEYIVANSVLKGERHPKVWHSPLNLRLKDTLVKSVKGFELASNRTLIIGNAINSALVKLRNDQVTMSGSDKHLFISRLADCVVDLRKIFAGAND